MNKFASLVIAVSFALTASAAATAADGDYTLRVDRGSVMTSTGGEYATALNGKVVMAGERLMVTEGSAATVFYGEDCQRQYDAPGVYVIQRECEKGAAMADGSSAAGAGNNVAGAVAPGVQWGNAAIIAGGVGVAAAILAAQDNSPGPKPTPPLSR